MEMYRIRKVDFQHIDERGSLTQLIHEGYKQVNVLNTKAGFMRGAHFHKCSVEAFYVISGSVEIVFRGKGKEQKVTLRKGDFCEIVPFVLHNMIFFEDCTMVQLYDIPVENKDGIKDIHTEEEFYA